MCAHVCDVALCGNTVRNVALGLWLVGHPCCTSSFDKYTFCEMSTDKNAFQQQLTLNNILHAKKVYPISNLYISSFWAQSEVSINLCFSKYCPTTTTSLRPVQEAFGRKTYVKCNRSKVSSNVIILSDRLSSGTPSRWGSQRSCICKSADFIINEQVISTQKQKPRFWVDLQNEDEKQIENMSFCKFVQHLGLQGNLRLCCLIVSTHFFRRSFAVILKCFVADL